MSRLFGNLRVDDKSRNYASINILSSIRAINCVVGRRLHG
jgi:hypothetical protein